MYPQIPGSLNELLLYNSRMQCSSNATNTDFSSYMYDSTRGSRNNFSTFYAIQDINMTRVNFKFKTFLMIKQICTHFRMRHNVSGRCSVARIMHSEYTHTEKEHSVNTKREIYRVIRNSIAMIQINRFQACEWNLAIIKTIKTKLRDN